MGEEKALKLTLKRYTGQKTVEIEELCAQNYQVFLEALEELLQTKTEARALKERVLALQDGVASAGGDLQGSVETLARVRQARGRAQRGREALEACMEVVGVMSRVMEYLEAGKHAAVLRLLEELDLAAVASFTFGRHVAARVPVLRARVRREVTDQLGEWLAAARAAGPRVGRAALLAAAGEEGAAHDELRQMGGAREGNEGIGEGQIQGGGGGLGGLGAGLGGDGEEAVSFRELVEGEGGLALGPPHRCSYIYGRLGEQEAFEQLYGEARRVQARQLADWGSRPLEGLCALVGFFVIEDAAGLRLLEEGTRHALWDGAVMQLAARLGQEQAEEEQHEEAEKIERDEAEEDEEAGLKTQARRRAQQVEQAERVARGLYLPLDRLQQTGRWLARAHVGQTARACGRAAAHRLLAACGEPPLSYSSADAAVSGLEEWGLAPEEAAELMIEGSAQGNNGLLVFTRGVPEARGLRARWELGVGAWLGSELGWERGQVDEALAEGQRHFGAGLQGRLEREGEQVGGGLGATVQLLVDAQLAAGLGQELAAAWQDQCRAAARRKLRELLGADEHEAEGQLADAWPYLAAVLGGAAVPAVLRLAGLCAGLDLVREAFASGPLPPGRRKAFLVAVKHAESWAEEQRLLLAQGNIADNLPQLAMMLQLAQLLVAGPTALDDFESERAVRWPLLRDSGALCLWLDRMREDGASFFGGAKHDKHAEALAKRLRKKKEDQ